MRLPRDLSGEALVKHLCKRWEYLKVHQVGSHIILQTQQPAPHRITLAPSRIQIRRAQELSWARPIIESPTMIVPNWQALGRAIPGDAYIKNF
jgi:hypothetical protein